MKIRHKKDDSLFIELSRLSQAERINDDAVRARFC